MDGEMTEPRVRVEVVELDDAGARQIRARERATELLRDRADDIRIAIQEAAEVALSALGSMEDQAGWRMTTLETVFGLTLAAEAGVIVGKASTEASFEVTLTIERQG